MRAVNSCCMQSVFCLERVSIGAFWHCSLKHWCSVASNDFILKSVRIGSVTVYLLVV